MRLVCGPPLKAWAGSVRTHVGPQRCVGRRSIATEFHDPHPRPSLPLDWCGGGLGGKGKRTSKREVDNHYIKAFVWLEIDKSRDP